MDLKERKTVKTIKSRHPWELARLEVIRRIIEKETPIQEKNTVLDVGCGDTFLVEKFSEQFSGTQFVAVDTAFNQDLLIKYRNILSNKPIQVYESLEKFAAKFKGTVSHVLLLDVIEHIKDDVGFLLSLKKYPFIATSTNFIITVPAFQKLFSGHDNFLGHYRRYSIRFLATQLCLAEMTKLRTGYFFFTLLPLRFLQVVKEKVIKPKIENKGVADWNRGSRISAFIRFCLLKEYEFGCVLSKAGIKLPGLSCYAICKPLN